MVGPACVLTHGTAGISFIALQFSDSDLIRKFGEAGLAATIIALIAVLSLVPVFGVLFVRNEKLFAVKFQSADAGVQALRNFCYWIAVRMVGRPGLFSLIAVVLVGGLGVVYANLSRAIGWPTRCRTSSRRWPPAPARRQADRRQSDRRADRVPQGRIAVFAGDACRPSRTFTRRSRSQAGVGNVWSLETLRRWLAEKAGTTDVATLKEYVNVIPEHLVRRFIEAEQDAVVVVGPRAGHRFQPDLAGRREARSRRWTRSARSIRAMRSPSPAFRRSPRATAPA